MYPPTHVFTTTAIHSTRERVRCIDPISKPNVERPSVYAIRVMANRLAHWRSCRRFNSRSNPSASRRSSSSRSRSACSAAALLSLLSSRLPRSAFSWRVWFICCSIWCIQSQKTHRCRNKAMSLANVGVAACPCGTESMAARTTLSRKVDSSRGRPLPTAL